MALGVALGSLVYDLRISVGDSVSESHGVETKALYARLLNMEQERLAYAFDWPQLRARVDVDLAAGQRYYDMPPEMDMQRAVSVHSKHSDIWVEVVRGIEPHHYNDWDSDARLGSPSDWSIIERSDPVRRWQPCDPLAPYPNDGGDGGPGNPQFEVWPVPATPGPLRFTGYRKVRRMVQDGDTADLDDQLLVRFAAAQILARRKAEDAQVQGELARDLLNTLRGRTAEAPSDPCIVGAAHGARGRRFGRAPYIRTPRHR